MSAPIWHDDAPMTAAEAEERIGRVTASIEAVRGDLIALCRGRAWIALGLESWEALCDERLGGVRFKLPITERQETVKEMTGAGMSIRAISSALGVSKDTVQRDRQAPGVSSETPATTGLDGKNYKRKRTGRRKQPPAVDAAQPDDPQVDHDEPVDPPQPEDQPESVPPITDEMQREADHILDPDAGRKAEEEEEEEEVENKPNSFMLFLQESVEIKKLLRSMTDRVVALNDDQVKALSTVMNGLRDALDMLFAAVGGKPMTDASMSAGLVSADSEGAS